MPEQAKTQRSRCSLLDLPAELRNQIYQLAVVEKKPITVTQRIPHTFTTYYLKPPERPALAQTCKQLQQEVLPVFFGQNTFVLDLPRGHSPQAWRELIRAWIRRYRAYVHLIRSVGAVEHLHRRIPATTGARAFRQVSSYVSVTMLGSGEYTEVWLGGELEEQCVCFVDYRNWDHERDRHLSPGAKFVEVAVMFSCSELTGRMDLVPRRCERCGCKVGGGKARR